MDDNDGVQHMWRALLAVSQRRCSRVVTAMVIAVPFLLQSRVEFTVSNSSAKGGDRWIPVPQQEYEAYRDYFVGSGEGGKKCAHQFDHCCIGQCRQSAYTVPPEQVLWKRNRTGQSSLMDVLEYMDRTMYRRKNMPFGGGSQNCILLFAGDSLSSDTAMAAVCQLTTAGYKLTSCNPGDIGVSQYGPDRNQACTSDKLYPGLAYFLLEDPMASSCPSVLVLFYLTYGVNKTNADLLTNIEGGGVFIWNWGVHCNGHDRTCMRRNFAMTLLPHLTAVHPWKFVFREHEPQHFLTEGGTYDPERDCGLLKDKSVVQLDNWRNEFVAELLQEYNLTETVSTIRLFRDLEPLWQLHHPSDCTHYCYSPWRFDVTWDGLLRSLKELDMYNNND